MEFDGEPLYEDEAVLALVYNAREEDFAVLAWGREALSVPERLHEMELLDVRDRSMCIVPVEEARWYDGDRGLDAVAAPKAGDPWEHHGEIVIVRPFAPGAGSIRTWVWLLRWCRNTLLSEAAAPRLGVAQRWFFRLLGAVDIILPERPADARAHDQLVQGLWETFGWWVRLDGAPARRSEPSRLTWRDWLVSAACIGVPSLGIAVRVVKGLPPLFAVTGTMAAVSATFAFLYIGHVLHRDPRAPKEESERQLLRALRAHVAAGEDAEPREYEGAGEFRFGAKKGDWTGFPAGMWMLLSVGGMALGALLFRDFMKSDLVRISFGVLVVAGLYVSIWLGDVLTRARLSLGEQGLTLRLIGVYARPLLIPYARIRHASMTFEAMGFVLRLRFHSGHEVSFGFPQGATDPLESRKLLLDVEAAIVARLGLSGSYRKRGVALAESGTEKV
ncbi:Hypothetical protein A7982_09860 [Minicystis rosea]|nr:Hypothetical protein A7982_09860 [Minicystis rosea]